MAFLHELYVSKVCIDSLGLREYGTAVLLEEVGKVIKEGGVGVTISSQSGHRMPALSAEADEQLVMAEAVKWGTKGARINSISPGIVVTPLAIDEFNGPRGDFYKHILWAAKTVKL